MLLKILSIIMKGTLNYERSYQLNDKYLIKVSELMPLSLPKPTRKVTVLANDVELLPLIIW